MSEGTDTAGTAGGVEIDTAPGLAVADVELRDAARVALLAFAPERLTAAREAGLSGDARIGALASVELISAELHAVSIEISMRREVAESEDEEEDEDES